MRKGVAAVILVVAQLCAFDVSAGSLDLRTPKDISPAAKRLLNESWPKVRKALPGLDKYSSDLSVVAVKDDLKAEIKEYRKVTVELLVPSRGSSIPAEFKALGHHCFVDIDPSGAIVTVSKRPCKAVALGRRITGTEHDTGSPMELRLK